MRNRRFFGVFGRSAHGFRGDLVAFLCAAAAVMAGAWTAAGQSVLGPESLEPGVTPPQVARAERVFELTEEQRALLSAAYAEYEREVAALAETMRRVRARAIEEFGRTRDGAVWRDLLTVGERFERRRGQFDRRLLGELRLLLSGEQEERWLRFERDRRRMIGLGRGGLVSGDAVDLIALAEEAGADTLDDEAGYAGVLRAYASAMDGVLGELEAKRVVLDRRAVETLDEMDVSSPEAALAAFQPILDERLALAVAVREVNKRFAGRIERALPGAVGERFGGMYRERVYPKVYRESTAERMAAAVRARGGGEEGLGSRVDGLMAAYHRERGVLDAAWVAAIDAAEASSTVGGLIAGMSEESAAERSAWRERRRLDARVARELRGLLEEVERLPEPAGVAGGAGAGSGGVGGGG